MRSWICVPLLAFACLAAADDTAFPAKKLTTPPTIDGVVNADEWAEAGTGSGFLDAENGSAAPNTGTFYLAYDEKFIYLAGKLDDKNPAGIRATETRTNAAMQGDDIFAIVVDPFGRTGGYNVFRINPKGATNMTISGGRAAKREWMGEFVAKGRITETGWECEAKIPWGIMRLPSPGLRDVSFNIYRYDPRRQRDYSWRYSPQTDEQYGRWLQVDVPKSGNQRSLKLLPYFFGGWDEKEKDVANAGIDFKSSISDQIDVVGTINPDFRNVENQILSLDFSRFERLAGESRPFFLEGQQFFQTSGDSPLFAPQRIRKFDAGFKSFGKLDPKTQFAVLDTIDFGKENAFVGTVDHQANTRFSAKGAIATYDKDSLHNLGTFGQLNYTMGPWFFFGQHMFTRDSVYGDARKYDNGFGYFGNGINAFIEHYSISEAFLPRIGFAPERNFKGLNGSLEYVKPMAKGPIMEWGFNVAGHDYTTQDNQPYRRGATVGSTTTLRDGTDIDLGVEVDKFFNSYDYTYFASLERPRGDPYRRWQLDYIWGRVAGEAFQLTNATVLYRPLKPLQMSLSVQHIRHFDTSTQSILGFNYDLSEDTSIGGRAVKRDGDTNFYVAYRKSGNRGAEYYVIFGDPNAFKFRTALVVKVVVPFELKF